MTPLLISRGWPLWIGALANHLWQSTVFAITIALLSMAFRRYQARVRYALWFAASLKFVVPVSLLIGLGMQLPPLSTPARAPSPVVSTVVRQISIPFDDPSVVTPFRSTPESSPAAGLMTLVFLIWIGGVLAIANTRWRAWRHLKALVDGASESKLELTLPAHVEVRWVSGVTEPGVIGFIRPVILLPTGIEAYLNRDQLDAVLTHELCHIDRHDNLTAAFHMLLEAVFWFHPVVWLIGARLIRERERACDEHVLSTCRRPDVYAEGILNVCKHYLDVPLACRAGVGGSDLKERIKMIIAHRVGHRLGVAARMLLVLLGISAIGVPLLVGALAVAPASAQRPEAAAAVGPAFEVASIKKALPSSEHIQAGQFQVGININGSRADYGFMSLADLIQYAYRVKRYQLSGPSWMNDTRWDIAAKIPADQPANRAPEMMRSLLAERFKVSIRRENREQTVFPLVVDRRGLKIKEAAAEEEASAGGLSVRINSRDVEISGGATGTIRLAPGPDGEMRMEMAKITMAALADRLAQFLDRPVVNATELNGNYQVTLDLPIEAMMGMDFAQKLAALAGLGSFGTARGSSAPDTLRAAIVQAVKDLGLELQSRKAPVETIIVDRAEKTPTAN